MNLLITVVYAITASIEQRIRVNRFAEEPLPAIKIAGIPSKKAPNCLNPPLVAIKITELNALLRPINSGFIFFVTQLKPIV